MLISGTITFQDFEGGFWGIVADDGQKFYPIEGIPTSLQKPDLPVEAEVEPSDEMSFVMWGQTVNLQAIRRL